MSAGIGTRPAFLLLECLHGAGSAEQGEFALGILTIVLPLALVVFNLGFGALAYQAGAWSDRVRPRSVLAAGMGVLIVADLILAFPLGIAGMLVGPRLRPPPVEGQVVEKAA